MEGRKEGRKAGRLTLDGEEEAAGARAFLVLGPAPVRCLVPFVHLVQRQPVAPVLPFLHRQPRVVLHLFVVLEPS